MRYIKNTIFIITVVLALVFFTGINSYAEDSSFQCNTDPELIQEMNNALIQKKVCELNGEYSPWSEHISLFSSFNGTFSGGITMPSTGDVRALVIQLEFPGHSLSSGLLDSVYDDFFGIHENADSSKFFTFDDERSVSELYKVHSNGKLNFTGDVMPIYKTKELPEYYSGDKYKDLMSEILSYYKEAGFIDDYSKYDANKDGYIDSLIVLFPFHSDLKYGGLWDNQMVNGKGVTIKDDSTQIKSFVMMYNSSKRSVSSHTVLHECGHLMGLPDNYPVGGLYENYCVLTGTGEIMTSGSGSENCYFNAYYRYLLDWIEPTILPYKDKLETINLWAYENTDDTNTERAIIFVPNSKILPFTEFYIAEYYTSFHIQNTPFNDKYSGVLMWHVNSEQSYSGGFLNQTSYLKPVYKNGGTYDHYGSFMYDVPNDLYIKDYEFSPDSEPTSNFYDDVYTGAYMKVLDMDSERTKVQVGFVNTDKVKQPTISISSPSKKAVKSGSQVFYTLEYDADNIGDSLTVSKDIYSRLNVTGTASALRWINNTSDEKIKSVEITSIKGEGTLGIEVGGKSAWNVSSEGLIKYASPVISETFYVDDTPPEIVFDSDEEIIWELGEKYVDSGVRVTDNLDPDIESKLVVDTSVLNVNKAGTYQIKYNATDHAGNVAEQKIRTITVTPISVDIRYSTTKPTNQDVTVTLNPSVPLVPNTKLTHTFTENGEYTFKLTDLEGNTLNKTVKVDWIDKEPPAAELSYSTTKFTNRDVTVTVTPSETVTDDTELSYTFAENGRHTFTITDLAGNSIQKTAEVNWIDKTEDIIKYSTTELTNQDVNVEFIPLNSNEEFTHTFNENGEYIFKYTDLDGKQQEKSINVDWIDKELPTAEIVYSTTEPTNKDVAVRVIPSERVIEGEEFTHTFTGNEKYIFTLTDLAGNRAEIETMVDWIDKEPPEVKNIQYSKKTLTNRNVSVLITASEPVKETTKDRLYTFKENGIHIFTLTDLAGNITELPIEVTWIDKTPPTGEIEYTANADGSVTAKLIPSEEIQETEITHVFAGAGSYTFTFTDLAGNEGIAVAEYDGISVPTPKPTPTLMPSHSPTSTPTAKPTASPSPTTTVEPTASPSPTPTATPTASPSPTPTVKPTASPTPTVKPTASPTPTPTATASPAPTPMSTASPSPTPTAKPTASPTPTAEPITTPTPTPTTDDRVEFARLGNAVSATLVFEKTTPPKSEDIVLYIAYYRDNRLIKLEIPTITEMTAMLEIDEALQDCEIRVLVWDKNMKPLMEVQTVILYSNDLWGSGVTQRI